MDGLNNSSEIITSSAHILGLLSRVKNSRTILLLHIEDLDPFNSIVLAINEKTLLLDQVKPEEGNGLMNKGRDLTITTKIQGIELNFDSKVVESLENNSFRIIIPTKMGYLQRRAHHRVYFSSNHNPIVTLKTDKDTLKGTVENISLGGVRMVFDVKEQVYFEQGQSLNNFTVQLGPSIHIISKIEVRDCQYNFELGKLSIGAQFLNLSKSQENSLSRYIATIEREMRRRS